MVNRKLMEGEVGRLMEGGFSNAEGQTIAVNTPDINVSRMDTAGLDGVVTKTIVKQRPVAQMDYNVETTTVSPNFDNRPVTIEADNASVGREGTTNTEPDMIAGDQVMPTTDARTSEETTTVTTEAPVAETGLTDTQKNMAWGLGLLVVAVGGYFVVKHFNK